ncbi:hypothetical protein B0H17DRAFT_1142885 [Mycena rosella]|uniref:Uncharacterized protein n=1 Tax=Mycena rosella TaxID=1033263 RepID=A0AAD7G4M5_MYCRO|nr:hypothetical protein B0H17DRAFT_1142885 [Mycena rosella]
MNSTASFGGFSVSPQSKWVAELAIALEAAKQRIVHDLENQLGSKSEVRRIVFVHFVVVTHVLEQDDEYSSVGIPYDRSGSLDRLQSEGSRLAAPTQDNAKETANCALGITSSRPCCKAAGLPPERLPPWPPIWTCCTKSGLGSSLSTQI